MRHVNRSLHDGGIHIHHWLVAHERASEQLHPVETHFQIVAGHLRSFFGRRCLGELHLSRQIDGMAVLWKNVTGKKHFGSGNLTGFDAAAQCERIGWLRS